MPDREDQAGGSEGLRPLEETRSFWGRKRYLALLAVAIVLSLAAVIVLSWDRVEGLGSYGYLGAFVIEGLGSATIIVPVPALAVVFSLGGVLKPWLVGLAAGLGSPLGELTGYLAGYSGRVALESSSKRAAYARIEDWVRGRGSIIVFLSAMVPNPLFDLVGIAAGVLRFPLWKFLLVCWAGKTIKNLGVAYAGFWGLRPILNWLGLVG